MQTEIQNHKTKAQNRTNGLDSLFPSKCKFIRSGLVRWGCWKRKPHTLIQCTTSNTGLTRWGRWKKNQHSLNLTRSFLIPKMRSQSSRGCRPFLFYFWETISWNPKDQVDSLWLTKYRCQIQNFVKHSDAAVDCTTRSQHDVFYTDSEIFTKTTPGRCF